MSFKTTYILFGILVGLLVVVGLTQQYAPKLGEGKFVASDFRAKTLKDTEITTVEIVRTRPSVAKLVFTRVGEQEWKLTEPTTTRVESFFVGDLIAKIRSLEQIEAPEMPRSLEMTGLQPPAAVVTLKKADGTAFTLSLGNETKGAVSNRLVSVVSSGRPSVPLAVERSKLDGAFKTLDDFRSKDLLADAASGVNSQAVVQAIQLTGFGDSKKELFLKREGAVGNRWRFDKPSGYGDADYEGTQNAAAAPIATPNGVRDLLAALDTLRVEYDPEQKIDNFAEIDVTDLAKYGLSDPPATLRAEVVRAGADKDAPPRKAVLLIGKKIDAKETLPVLAASTTSLLGTSGPLLACAGLFADLGAREGSYYARLESENNVVKLSARSVAPLLNAVRSPVVYRNRNLLEVPPPRVDAIDLKTAAGLIKLRRNGDPPQWRVYDDAGKPSLADMDHIAVLVQALTVPRQVKGWPEPGQSDQELGLDEKSQPTEVTVWVDGLKDVKEAKDPKVEPKPGKPTYKLWVGPIKKIKVGGQEVDAVFARREHDGETLRLEVPTTLVKQVTEGRVAYLDRTLPTFPAEADVTKLTIAHGADVFVLEKDNKKEWKFVQPAELKDRIADPLQVSLDLRAVRELNADKLVNDKPTKEELDHFGLLKPEWTVAVVVKKDDKNEEHIYHFAGLNEAKDGRYAKQDERDVVFLVQPEVVNVLQGELVPRTVFSFDPAKVKSMKLVGWKPADKPAVTLDLAHKEGAPRIWTAKTEGGGDVEVDAVKVESLAVLLSRLKADKYLLFKTGPKPEHKLDEKDGALRVEIVLDGEKTPLTITFGGPAGEGAKGVIAQSSTLPGDVFVVQTEPFTKLVAEGVKYFAKEEAK